MNVLIADDDGPVRLTLKRLLRSLGCTILEAPDGITALELLSTNQVSLLILDLTMPGLSGLDVLQAIRGSREQAGLPVVVVSGASEAGVAKQVIELGVSDFLTKPIRFDTTKTRLEQVIAQLTDPGAIQAPASSVPAGVRPVVVVDGNSEFRYFVENALAPDFTTVQAESGVEAVRICESCRPAAVVIGEDIGLFGPQLLARKIQGQSRLDQTRVIFVRPACDPIAAADPSAFAEVITRTFVAEEFAAEFRQIYGRLQVTGSSVFSTVQKTLVSATLQAVGMMAHTDVSMVAGTHRPEAGEFIASVDLHMLSEQSAARLTLACPAASAARIGARLLQMEESEVGPDDSLSAVGELINVIAGRVKGAIVEQGGKSNFSLPDIKVAAEALAVNSSDVVLHFESGARDVSFVIIMAPIDATAKHAA